jgi:hypothetical protein
VLQKINEVVFSSPERDKIDLSIPIQLSPSDVLTRVHDQKSARTWHEVATSLLEAMFNITRFLVKVCCKTVTENTLDKDYLGVTIASSDGSWFHVCLGIGPKGSDKGKDGSDPIPNLILPNIDPESMTTRARIPDSGWVVKISTRGVPFLGNFGVFRDKNAKTVRAVFTRHLYLFVNNVS